MCHALECHFAQYPQENSPISWVKLSSFMHALRTRLLQQNNHNTYERHVKFAYETRARPIFQSSDAALSSPPDCQFENKKCHIARKHQDSNPSRRPYPNDGCEYASRSAKEADFSCHQLLRRRPLFCSQQCHPYTQREQEDIASCGGCNQDTRMSSRAAHKGHEFFREGRGEGEDRKTYNCL